MLFFYKPMVTFSKFQDVHGLHVPFRSSLLLCYWFETRTRGGLKLN